jgi:hypothetical protein
VVDGVGLRTLMTTELDAGTCYGLAAKTRSMHLDEPPGVRMFSFALLC